MGHSIQNYVPRGRGILYIAEWNENTPPSWPDDFTEVGNCPSLSLEPTRETSPHYSSRQGLRERDLNPTVQLEYNINFDCDELSAANLAKFFMGSLQTNDDIYGMMNYEKEYALRFYSQNPIGPNRMIKMHRVTIGPSGPLQLIGDEYLVMSFAGEGLADRANNPASPFFSFIAATTTTTTTTTD